VQQLPYAPLPHSDELLSSWTERIGIFYGIGYLRARVIIDPNRAANSYGENEDLDASEDLRRLLVSWTGHGENAVPPVLPKSTDEVLDVSARLAYCPSCWFDDAKSGQSPYVRRAWASWSTVLCAEHQTWLCARRPGAHTGSELNGWAPVWQSIPVWAAAACLQHDPVLREFTRGFDAEMARPPMCGWHDLDCDIQGLIRGKSRIVSLVARPECFDIRAQVWEAIAVSNTPRVTELDLRGYRRDKPGWLTERICCVSLAAEIRRMALGLPPAFDAIRSLLEAHPDASKLLRDCRRSTLNVPNS
jgi:hypothetical protein